MASKQIPIIILVLVISAQINIWWWGVGQVQAQCPEVDRDNRICGELIVVDDYWKDYCDAFKCV